MARPSRKKLANYKQVQLSTASPGQKIVLLYDGIIKFLNIALLAGEDKSPSKYETIHNSLQHARVIIEELRFALDLENGGEIAANLDNLYTFWIESIYDANSVKEVSSIQEVLGMITDMRNTWQEADDEARKSGIT